MAQQAAMSSFHPNLRFRRLYHHVVLILVCIVESLSFSHHRLHIKNGRQSFRQKPSGLFSKTPSEASGEAIHSGNRLMIFGLGNVGSLVAQRSTSLEFIDDNNHDHFFDDIYGTSRSGKEIAGVKTIDFDAHEEIVEVLPSCTHILITIPPVDVDLPSNVDNNDTANATYFCDPVLNHPKFSVQELLPANTWVGFISSTSVYGNHDGAWVTEESKVKCSPGTKGELYFRAENEWREVSEKCGWGLHVFRSAGLYGDNRSAIHTIRKKGVPPVSTRKDSTSEQKKTQKIFPTSRIHEEDVSRAVLSAMMYEVSVAGNSCLWNLADDEPAPRSEVMAFGTKLLEDANLLPEELERKIPPRQKQSERERRRGTDRKRVGNQKLKDLILPDGKLLYPTYQYGLRAVLDSNRNEWSADVASEQ